MKYNITIFGLGYDLYDEHVIASVNNYSFAHVLNLREIDLNDFKRLFPESKIIDLERKPCFLEPRIKTYKNISEEIVQISQKSPLVIPVIGDPYFLEGVSRQLISDLGDSIRVIRGVSVLDKTIELFPEALSTGALCIFDLSHGIENLSLLAEQNYLLVQYGRVGSKLNTLGYQPSMSWLQMIKERLLGTLSGTTQISIINIGSSIPIRSSLLVDLEKLFVHMSQATSIFIHASESLSRQSATEDVTIARLISPLEEMLNE